MKVFGVILGICALLVSIFFIVRYVYISFVKKYSIRIAKINEINKEFIFYPYVSYDQKHTYDNESFYNQISERDYLIYQLQFYSKKITDQIKLMSVNRDKFQKYIQLIKSNNVLGQYNHSTKGYIVKLLNYYENKLCQKCIQSPNTDYFVTVILYLSKINGEIYRRKSRTFYSNDILALIDKLNDKSGAFYRDRDVWDAICRVERGKVSNKIRFAVYKRDGYRCRRCHKSQNVAYLEVDHIIPIAKGGKSTFDNLQTLCHDCNVAKGDKIE